MSKTILVPACVAASLLALATVTSVAAAPLVVGNTKYVVRGLVGVGRLPASLRDEHGETFGSISGLNADASSWSRNGDTYTGTFYATPDRGYNAAGTIDYQPRINRLGLSFTPVGTSGKGFAQDQIELSLEQAQKLFEVLPGVGPRALSGLDPVPVAWPPAARAPPPRRSPSCRRPSTASSRSMPRASSHSPMDRG